MQISGAGEQVGDCAIGLAEAPTAAAIDALPAWVDVLVDAPGAQAAYTYRCPPSLDLQVGDILSVPFGAQQVGAIAIGCPTHLAPHLDPATLRSVTAVLSRGFFPPSYWSLLNRVAAYYYTPLMQVVRGALPPGLLTRSQRRVRLVNPASWAPQTALQTARQTGSLIAPAAQMLDLLKSSKTGDYSWQYLQRQVPNAARGLQHLLKSNLVEQYLEPPKPARPKQRQAVTLVSDLPSLTPKQRELLHLLARHGGELWLTELLQQGQASSATVRSLAAKGCVIVQAREVLRTATAALNPDLAGSEPLALTPAQLQAVTHLNALTDYATVLLHGVTGSGKTEVYLQAIAPRLQRGQSVLVLVPEIGLTPQLTDRFRARFGDRVCVYHSALSDGERYDTWRQMLSGSAQVVIGTRSAIFAPLHRLGLIVLDEEHDSSFKQDQPAPCYHARTVAQWRAELEQCPLVLGSATPSLESWQQRHAAQHHYLALPERVQARPLPPIEVVDMRVELAAGVRSIFSRSLQSALQDLQDRRQQGILFIHRRGHSTFVSCRSCGYVVTCPHCDVSLAYHQVQVDATPILRCHYCNYAQSTPTRCPSCDSGYFKHFGSGTQRVTQELSRQFPGLRLLRFDSDTTRTKGAHRALLGQFAAGEADVLVGTQMLTKGIDLPQVTLVGIIAADGLLHFADFRSSERTFQTLTQVAGRCGRGQAPGRVILQTYTPNHPVITAVQAHDYDRFITAELQQRASLNYPPFGRLILLKFSSHHPAAVQQAADLVARSLMALNLEGIEVLGPAPATILRVARRYRWQLLLKRAASTTHLPDLTALRALCPSTVSLTIDVDPMSLL